MALLIYLATHLSNLLVRKQKRDLQINIENRQFPIQDNLKIY